MMDKIILDFDGTLLNSKYRHKKLIYDILHSRAAQIKFADLADFVEYKRNGKSTLMYLNERYPNLDNSDINQEWISKIENIEYQKYDKLYDDTLIFLEALKRKYSIILVTSRKNKEELFNQLKKFNLTEYFNNVVVVNPGESKYKKVIELFKVIKYVIGDTEDDYELATKFDCIFFAMNRGFRNKEFWRRQKVYSYAKLLTILPNINILND